MSNNFENLMIDTIQVLNLLLQMLEFQKTAFILFLMFLGGGLIINKTSLTGNMSINYLGQVINLALGFLLKVNLFNECIFVF